MVIEYEKDFLKELYEEGKLKVKNIGWNLKFASKMSNRS